jgi:hypothetical protein
VVTSAYSGTTLDVGLVLHIRCSLYPNSHPLVRLRHNLAYVSIPGHGTIPSFIDDLCHTLPFDFKRALSVATTYGLTNPSETNRFSIFVILSFKSVDITFNLLSKVRLLGGRYDKDRAPHTFMIFLLYGKSKHRK